MILKTQLELVTQAAIFKIKHSDITQFKDSQLMLAG